jgi:energy coupling factor transporter S component ThiW
MYFAALGEMVGTGIIGGLRAYPIAHFLLGNAKATWYVFLIPFSVNTICGALIGYLILIALNKATKGIILKD